MAERVLYLMITGAGPAEHVGVLIDLALAGGWSVHCLATPAAVEHFLDLGALRSRTGHAVRTGYRGAGQPALPKADAVIVAPATYNTVNKFAAGIADTYVTTQLAELHGLGVPVVVLPFVNGGLAISRPFSRSVAELRESGVRVLWEAGSAEPVAEAFPWQAALAAVEAG
ncbi:flavoprotein [Amycolatopsis minnesotensis]|uniref:Flavoprotein n=1 Tax=Amycolatopsis minnesotensis TaxID=337894 RepID=A0ABP5DXI4_9PSEU